MIISTQNRATIAKVMFLGFLLATLLLAWSPLVGTEPAQAALPTDSGKIAFASNRTTGTGVNNPQGDYEIFIMSPDGTNTKQLTRNAVDDFEATLSSDGKKVAYASRGDQTS